ncbi:MAG: DNA mismatch repair endonuclease MutL [Desulfohalobiaceae bacterium]|nr:DNA mismatch repair endonuclease MutL [Desulfohalobiaceae bacterium]
MSQAEKRAGIMVLPSELQNQIAAGEVVERPASVLKELAENSLDAGADRVDAAIESGGQGLISVQDNGMGLSPEELPQALTRHATSKIRSVQDLMGLNSFGFRGEALPSIASVSRLRITSTPARGGEGSSLEVEFGAVSEPRPAAVREGTLVEVRDLFLNTPARLKFLKKQSTEAKKCQDVLQRLALVNRHCSFRLRSNRREVLDFERNQTLLQRLETLWPKQITASLLSVHREEKSASIHGYVGHPDTGQGRADRILFFVNKRPVQDKLLLSALKQAYSGRLLSREYPQAVLFLELPPSEVDVNVHPAKSEVRFREEKAVYSLLVNAVQNTLAQGDAQGAELKDRIPGTRHGDGNGDAERRKAGPGRLKLNEENKEPDTVFRESGEMYRQPDTSQGPPDTAISPRIPDSDSGASLGPDLAYLGQFRATYLILRSGDKLLFVDQHAAHERVLYTRYLKGAEAQQTQRLALPLRLRLHPSERTVLDGAVRNLREIGFAIHREDEENISVQGIPQYLDRSAAGEFLRDVLRQGGGGLEDMWCLMACRNSVKAGETLALSEAVELLRSWLECPERQHCPHGRPVSAQLGPKDLERMFKRGK